MRRALNKTMGKILEENDQVPSGPLRPSQSNRAKLFLTAFLQVFLVSGNTYFVSQLAWVGIAVCAFGISYVWTLNVKRISASSTAERLVYATGAMLGGLAGVLVGKVILAGIN